MLNCPVWLLNDSIRIVHSRFIRLLTCRKSPVILPLMLYIFIDTFCSFFFSIPFAFSIVELRNFNSYR